VPSVTVKDSYAAQYLFVVVFLAVAVAFPLAPLVLARLLALNTERAAAEHTAGLTAVPDEDDSVDEDEAD